MSYDKQFREEALKLSDEVGVRKAAEQLGIKPHTLYDWRSQRIKYGDDAFVGSGNSRKLSDPRERRIYELEKENRELQKANEILKDALGFFASSRKK